MNVERSRIVLVMSTILLVPSMGRHAYGNRQRRLEGRVEDTMFVTLIPAAAKEGEALR